MRSHLLRAIVLGSVIAVLIAAGGYYAYAQTAAPEAAEHELAAEAAGAWLGVIVAPSSDQSGALVLRVLKDGPAAKAGVQARDVITAIAGTPVATPAALKTEMEKHSAGQTISLSLRRGNSDLQINLALEAAPQKPQRPNKPVRPSAAAFPFLPGMMKGAFANTVGGSFTVIENGAQVTYRAVFGKASAATDSSVTVNPNGGGAAVTYQIGATTKLRSKGSNLKADDKVVAITKDSSTQLVALTVVRERQKSANRTEGNSGEDKSKSRVQDMDIEGFGVFEFAH